MELVSIDGKRQERLDKKIAWAMAFGFAMGQGQARNDIDEEKAAFYADERSYLWEEKAKQFVSGR